MDHDRMSRDGRAVDDALAALSRGNVEHAEALLERVAASSPSDYVREYERGGVRHMVMWDQEEVIHFTQRALARGETVAVAFVWNTYARAHFVLGYLAEERGDHAAALRWLDAGLRLEAHPHLKLEKAHVLAFTGDRAGATRLYEEVLALGEDAVPSARARAMRGLAVLLVEQGRLEEAEKLLRQSKRFEPDSQLAANELRYIKRMRRGEAPVTLAPVGTISKQSVKCGACDRPFEGRGCIVMVQGRQVFLCATCARSAAAARMGKREGER